MTAFLRKLMSKNNAPKSAAASFEQLEGRALFSVTAFVNILGELNVIGTAGDDRIAVSYSDNGTTFDPFDNKIFVRVNDKTTITLPGWNFNRVFMWGHEGNDHLTNNTPAPSQIFGGDGNDTLVGGMHSDLLDGQFGDDTLYGKAGNDGLFGDFGRDALFGGDGDDMLDTGFDLDFNETAYGGSGWDRFRHEPSLTPSSQRARTNSGPAVFVVRKCNHRDTEGHREHRGVPDLPHRIANVKRFRSAQ
jgi:hypothetical protein